MGRQAMRQNLRGPTVMYDVKAIKRPIPGKWYVGFACQSCERLFAVLNDDGRVPADQAPVKTSPGIDINCPYCEMVATYSPQHLARFQAPDA